MTKSYECCACCGHLTISGDGDGCQVFSWEASLADESTPDVPGAANAGLTLRQAQTNFKLFGDSDVLHPDSEPLTDRVRGRKKDPDWKPLSPPS